MTTISITQPDVTLLMDNDGIIRNASFSMSLAESSVGDWVGRPWGDTVSGPGHEAVRRMIADAQATGVSAFNQIVQRLPSGRELPVEYTTLMLGAKAGFIAVGKSLQAVTDLQSKLVAAQQSMERDFWKLREIETRYRQLFEASSEPVLLVRDASLRISEANLAAIRALGLAANGPEGVLGMELLPSLDPDSRNAIQSLIDRAREHGKSPALTVQLGRERRSWHVRTSLVMSDPGPVYLIQLSPAGRARPRAEASESDMPLERLLERLPDAFAVVDGDGLMLRCNSGFLDLVEVSSTGAAIGQRLGKWLSRPGADWTALLETLQRHRAVRLFATTLVGELGTERRVELTAVGNTDSKPTAIAVLLRDVERRFDPSGEIGSSGPAAMADVAPGSWGGAETANGLVDKVGTLPLKDLIDEAVSMLERQCIGAALIKTNGNRRAASELLGLSRQTLYTKISKYGLDPDSTVDFTVQAAGDLDGDS